MFARFVLLNRSDIIGSQASKTLEALYRETTEVRARCSIDKGPLAFNIMGLDISHDTWHGAYSAFMRWRREIANKVGIDLNKMEGFCDAPVFKWDALKYRPVHEVLSHSDCDGEIEWGKLNDIANDLESILPFLEGDGGGHIGSYKEKTQQFIDGCRLAYSEKENIEFR